MDVFEGFRAGHEEIERLKRAAATELGRPITTVRATAVHSGCGVVGGGGKDGMKKEEGVEGRLKSLPGALSLAAWGRMRRILIAQQLERVVVLEMGCSVMHGQRAQEGVAVW
jgi:hypothetical protein